MRKTGKTVGRTLLLLTGTVSLILGAVGLFLPLIPTTPFILLAAWCFMKSSPRFHAWLLQHPTFGPLHDAWVQRGAIPSKAKFMAFLMITLSLVSVWWVVPIRAVQWGLTVVLLAVVAFIASRPS